jgi:hypothetical protein
MLVVVGVCMLTFHLPGNRSLKGKRQVVKRICERLRNRFHISVAEVASQDLHRMAKIGVALVGNDVRVLHTLLDQINKSLEEWQLAPLLDRQFEMLHYGSDFAGEGSLGELEEDVFIDREEEELWLADGEDQEESQWPVLTEKKKL